MGLDLITYSTDGVIFRMEIWRVSTMGIAQARWMVYFMEKPNLKWMI